MTLAARLRSVLSGARERAGREGARTTSGAGDERTSRDEPETGLFECSTCDTVYVAVDKTTCSTCDEPVEQVSATLSTE